MAAILSWETTKALFYHAKPRSGNHGGEAWRGKTRLFWSPRTIWPPCDMGESWMTQAFLKYSQSQIARAKRDWINHEQHVHMCFRGYLTSRAFADTRENVYAQGWVGQHGWTECWRTECFGPEETIPLSTFTHSSYSTTHKNNVHIHLKMQSISVPYGTYYGAVTPQKNSGLHLFTEDNPYWARSTNSNKWIVQYLGVTIREL